MRRVFVSALVSLLLVVGLPLGMGMADMGRCPACPAPDAPFAMTMCLATLTTGVLIALAFSDRVPRLRDERLSAAARHEMPHV